MLVLALLGLLTALGLPRVGPALARAQLRAAEEQLADLLVDARARALAERRCVRVDLDATSAVVRVGGSRCGDELAALEARRRLSLASVALESVRVEVGGRPRGAIAFDAQGRLTDLSGEALAPGSIARAALFPRELGERAAVVVWPTGLVEIEHRPGEAPR